ncbi:MAG: ABC transporter substrate-binding protein, partial [Spirochaetota bacterium]
PVLAGSDLYSNTVVKRVFETLYDYDYFATGYPLIPLLADGLPQVDEDNLVYTFTIKKGVYYYDPRHEVFEDKQREAKAEDFVYSILRLSDLSQKGKGYWLLDGFIEGLDQWREDSTEGGNYEQLPSGLKVLDDYRFQVKLTKPYPQLLYFFAMNYSAPLPKEVYEQYGLTGLTNRAIGTGAYYLDPNQTIDDNRYVYLVNPTYRNRYVDSENAPEDLKGKKLPLNGGINVRLIEESAPAWLAFQQGELDIYSPGKDQFDQAVVNNQLTPELEAKGVSLMISARASLTYNFFNYEDLTWGPLMRDPDKGPKIRKAIQLALDYETISEVQYNNRASAANSPIPPTFTGFEDLVSRYNAYDPEKAKQLLAEAGFPEGEGLPQLKYDAASSSKASRDLYELFQRYMSDIGIQTAFIVNDWPTFASKLDTGDFQYAGLGWNADYPDPQNFLQLLYGPNSSNYARYRSAEFNELYEKSLTMQPSPERTELYKQMVAIADEDHPWIYGVNRQVYAMTHKRLRNYHYNQFANNIAQYLQIFE